MANEFSHATNISNFKTLADYVGAINPPTDYAPSNANLSVANLGIKHIACKNANDAVGVAFAPLKQVQNDRSIAFAPLDAVLTSVMGYLRSTDASKQEIDDAYSFVKRIRGTRTSDVVADDPATPEDESSISASHQSYVQKAQTFRDLIVFLGTVTVYNPAENNIKIVGLTGLRDDMETANAAFGAATQNLAAARNTRNIELYHPTTGLVQRAKQVKAYLKKFGIKSMTYTTANAIKFKTLVKVLA